MSKSTKAGNLSGEFLRAAALNPEGALSVMFFAAFGVDLATLMQVAQHIFETRNRGLMILAVDAAVQIRNHVVFVGRDYNNVRTAYPVLVIEGQRPQQDIYNFSALHALGHIICHCSSSSWAKKALAKAGSCITGRDTTDSEAGKINKEIASGWASEDVARFGTWVPGMITAYDTMITTWFTEMVALKAGFGVSPNAGTSAGGQGGGGGGFGGSGGGSSGGKKPVVPEKPGDKAPTNLG